LVGAIGFADLSRLAGVTQSIVEGGSPQSLP